jgi:23S rRNA pseudouridine2605 synthase
MIADGKVSVNGEVITAMGVQVEPDKDTVSVDGKPIKIESKLVYIMFNKPRTVMTTMYDKEGRDCVADYFKDLNERIYPVGRLDYMTEGMLLMTNDGDLTNKLTHPSHKVYKHYSALAEACPSEEDLELLRNGIMLEDGITAPAKVQAHKMNGDRAIVQISIHEGRNRQVRRMLDVIGCEVSALRRTGIGDLTLGDLTVGKWRYLTDSEIEYLKNITK